MAGMPREPDKKYKWGPVQVGWDSPQFPRVGPKDPSPLSGLNYESQIDTKPFGAIDPGITARITTTANPFSGQRATDSSGDKSRAAFSKGLTYTSNNAVARSIDKFNTEYQTQAEKSLAEDMLAQAQSAHDKYRMDVLNAMFRESRAMQYDVDLTDIRAYARREILNAQAKVAAHFLGMA